jgi:hypothetical protein
MACNLNQPAQRPMGIGRLGDRNLSIKRKFRWTLQIVPYCAGSRAIGPNFVKTSARPNYDIEETELNFLNAKTWIAGKLTWQSITATFIDANALETSRVCMTGLVMNAQLSNNDSVLLAGYVVSATTLLTAELILILVAVSRWKVGQLDNVWPQAVNFGELGLHLASEEATIELTLRYDQVCYQGYCPNVEFKPCCSPCQVVPGTFFGQA